MNGSAKKRLQAIVERRQREDRLSSEMQRYRAEAASLYFIEQIVKETPSLSLLVRTESMGFFLIDPSAKGALLAEGVEKEGGEVRRYQSR